MLEITTFGSFRISDGTTEKTDWENQFLQLVKLLLYLLLHRNEAVSTEKLVEAVWQEAEIMISNLRIKVRHTTATIPVGIPRRRRELSIRDW